MALRRPARPVDRRERRRAGADGQARRADRRGRAAAAGRARGPVAIGRPRRGRSGGLHADLLHRRPGLRVQRLRGGAGGMGAWGLEHHRAQARDCAVHLACSVRRFHSSTLPGRNLTRKKPLISFIWLFLELIQMNRGKMPKTVQIGADVAEDLRDRVFDYAASLGISESALLHLLVRRELRLKRLDKLDLTTAVKKANPRFRVTAHKVSDELRARFHDHVRSMGIDPGVAIASIVGVELRERWLQTT